MTPHYVEIDKGIYINIATITMIEVIEKPSGFYATIYLSDNRYKKKYVSTRKDVDNLIGSLS